jgi:gliding motility-associated-like protein
VEGCSDISFEVHRTGDLASSYTVDFVTSGTATNGVDYTGIPSTYTFSPGQTVTTITGSVVNDGNTEGVEIVTITGQYLVCGYQFTDTLTFTISDGFPMTADPDTSMCLGGGQINLTSNYPGATSYKWTPTTGLSNANISNPVATVNSSMVYYVTAIDANGCIAQDSVVITIGADLGLTTTTTDVSCNGGNDGQATVSTTSANGPFSYLWNDINFQTTVSATNLNVGTYQVIVTDQNGCSDDTTVSINEADPLSISISPDEAICMNGNATITALAFGGITPYTYTWDNGLYSSSSQVVSPAVTTTYTVFSTDANNCISADTSVTITVSSPVTLSLSASPGTTVCPNEAITITATASGGIPSYLYNWGASLYTTNDSLYTLTVTQPTYIYVDVMDNCNYLVKDSILVDVYPLPLIDVLYPDNDGCVPLTVNFFDNTSPTPLSYTWGFGDPVSGVNNVSSMQSPTHTYTEPGTYSIDIIIVTANGCIDSMPFTNIINVYANPVADFYFTPEVGTVFEPIIDFIDASMDATSWQWDFGDNSTSVDQNTSHMYNDTGYYKIDLMVESVNGCVDSVFRFMEIKGQYAFYAPTAFTPNADGINDSFMPTMFGIDPDNFEMYIFNRWGSLIYQTVDITKPWDGKHGDSSKNVIEDVYIWKVKTKDIFEEFHWYTGHVNMIK